MQGKVLSDSVIRGKDGKRYAYESSDIQGCDSAPPMESEVDFEVKDGKAVDIIITKAPFDATKTFKGFDFSLKFKIIFGCAVVVSIMFPILDIILLPFLIVGSVWYLLFGRKKK